MIIIDTKTYLEVEDVAIMLKIPKRTVIRLVKLGQLEAFRPSKRKTFFTKEMVMKYMEKPYGN